MERCEHEEITFVLKMLGRTVWVGEHGHKYGT